MHHFTSHTHRFLFPGLITLAGLALTSCNVLRPSPLNRISSTPLESLNEAARLGVFTENGSLGIWGTVHNYQGGLEPNVRLHFRRLRLTVQTSSDGIFFVSIPMRKALRIYQDKVRVALPPHETFVSQVNLLIRSPMDIYLSLPSATAQATLQCGSPPGPDYEQNLRRMTRKRVASLRREYSQWQKSTSRP